jgi:hypothetical protein
MLGIVGISALLLLGGGEEVVAVALLVGLIALLRYFGFGAG